MTNEPGWENRQKKLFLCLMAYRLDKTMRADEYVRVVQGITDEMKSIAKAELLSKIEKKVEKLEVTHSEEGLKDDILHLLSKYKTL